jgi:MoaA/NifB/PqqE/SkfB family radical SAM enzyme
VYSYDEVEELHLELTSYCNASCPQCPRNISGGAVNPHLPLSELTLEDIRAILPDELIARLKVIYMCGNYGDAAVARDTIAVFSHFRSLSPKSRLGIHTNGGVRPPEWWRELARVVDYCRFGIDGLQDTNHLYRRGTNWHRIMANVAAFIDAGGNAEWDFIVFRHNEHQIEEAVELSRRLGFRKFFVKYTQRFFDAVHPANAPKRTVQKRDGSLDYIIEPPAAPTLQNKKTAVLARDLKGYEDYLSYIATTPITCHVVTPKRIYVSAEGLVFPCCYTANIYRPNKPTESGEIWQLIQRLPRGKASLDGKLTPIRSIINGPFFQELIPHGWREGRPDDGRVEICARTCGSHQLAADSTRLV